MNFLSLISIGLCSLLIIVYKINQSKCAIYNFKYYFYYIFVSTCAFLWIPYFATRPKDVRNLLTASTVLNPISNMINLKWELRGSENISDKKSVIMVANHQSSLDILGMFAIWHTMGKVTVIAKKELLYAGPFGLAAWLCGLVFINKRDPVESRVLMKEAMELLKEQNIKLWVFPEGTRRNTGEIHQFKKGAFYLAIETKTPIVPIVYSSYQTFLNDREKIFNPGEVIIEALPGISTENYSIDNVDKLIEKTKNLMEITFQRNSLEIKNRKRYCK